jgi:hypothetical protein
MNLIASPYSGWLEMGRGQVVKASGFDPVIPGSNPGVPAKTHSSWECLGLVADTLLSDCRVRRELEAITALRQKLYTGFMTTAPG